tara:strand:- start:179 stop:403 length:225 start_codon:yes stop_codon:yes gene_type:complete
MIRKLKDLEQEAMDELTPEDYEYVKERVNSISTSYERTFYKAGYIDGLQAAVVAASENSDTNSYTIEIDDIFDE